MLTLSGLVGFFYSVTGALLQAVIFKIVGYDRFADGVGLSIPFKAIGNLIGGPLAGTFNCCSIVVFLHVLYLSLRDSALQNRIKLFLSLNMLH
jgi:hypothetical protein